MSYQKHFGRNKTEVQRKLSKTSVALFISESANRIDSSTLDELKYLKAKKNKHNRILTRRY